MKLALLALLLTACGSTPTSIPTLPSFAPRAEWTVNSSGTIVWSSEHGAQSIDTYPVGWYSWWGCALFQGSWQEVYLNERAVQTPSGPRFVPADQMPVATSYCWDDALQCPEHCTTHP